MPKRPKRPKEAKEITFYFAVTVVPDENGRIKLPNVGSEYYVKSDSGTDSLHPFDVMDAIRRDLNSADRPSSAPSIYHCLWHVKSVKLSGKKEDVHAIDEDGGTQTAGAT